MAKLKFDDIIDIRNRKRQGEAVLDLAKEYNVTPGTIVYHTRDIKAISRLERVKRWEQRMGILPIGTDAEAVNS